MAFDPRNPNLSIWLREEPTDPDITKAFSRGGGFKGTALNATWVVKRLTAAFGPVGWGWGYEVLHFDDVHTQDGEAVNFAHIQFWYYPEGRKSHDDPNRAVFEQVGGTALAGKYGSGKAFLDDEARKKSLTDAILKAASHIGIGADIHLGRFDDSKYVAERRVEEDSARKSIEREIVQEQREKLLASLSEMKDRLAEVQDMGAFLEVKAFAVELWRDLSNAGMTTEAEDLIACVDKAGSRVGAPAKRNTSRKAA